MSGDDLTDEQLVARTADGDASAFEVFYERYAAAVMGLAVRIMNSPALAEEVVQETFWRVWRSADSFHAQRGAFAGWLFGIARNLAIDLCRRRSARPQSVSEHDDDPLIDRMPDPAMDVAESAWTAIKHQQVHAALAALSADQRQVIELAYFGGLTRQEIAATTGEPLGTIHTRARLALKKLRETLRAQGFED
ncbi:MAG: sigma-70 family RNA polymerase sigma factor [Chloroflexi bacterium]|nr:sigma-70 family RNA polymerase sigma factor [Chloroflexota bacterium]